MSFWKRRKRVSGRGSSAADTGRAQKYKKSVKRSPPVAMEIKVLAVEALDAVRLRLADRSVPIVALSSEAPDRHLLRSGQLTSWLEKPFGVPALVRQVQHALAERAVVDTSTPGGS